MIGECMFASNGKMLQYKQYDEILWRHAYCTTYRSTVWIMCYRRYRYFQYNSWTLNFPKPTAACRQVTLQFCLLIPPEASLFLFFDFCHVGRLLKSHPITSDISIVTCYSCNNSSVSNDYNCISKCHKDCEWHDVYWVHRNASKLRARNSGHIYKTPLGGVLVFFRSRTYGIENMCLRFLTPTIVSIEVCCLALLQHSLDRIFLSR